MERATNQPLSKEELKRLLKGLEKNTGIHSMLNIVLCSGMSVEDALNIHLADLDYSKNQIMLFDRYLGRRRTIKLPERVMRLISLHQNGYEGHNLKLYGISDDVAGNRLYDLSQQRLGKPISWSSVRHTWAVMAFENNIRFKDMVESSGASPEQLSRWSLYRKEDQGVEAGVDFLAQFY